MAQNTPYGLGDPASLDKIDKLFACGIGDLIDLPQIVVVGDQSSGKSSVLEGLIRMPLPRDSGLCTRFATQIVFKRSSTSSILISIIPAPNATDEHKVRVGTWSGQQISTLDSTAFLKIMKEVHEIMGLVGQEDGIIRETPTFSQDVLRIQICGPDQEHLSVVDVPGIFKNTTPGITKKDDISLVRNMVLGYMKNPRSVMLTVIPANVDVATQEILEMAADLDSEGKRTVGVLTKPDLVDRGAEPRIIDLLEGRAHALRLGWHLVRNLGQSQLSDTTLDRANLEHEFFSNVAPWTRLSKDKVGIDALRVRLQDILSDLVRQEFPKVKTEIGRKLTATQAKLDQLGMERGTPEKQRVYLTELSMKFQRLVSLSLTTKYGSDTAFDEQCFRLATLVTDRNATFAEDLRQYGHRFNFATMQHSRTTGGNLPAALEWASEDFRAPTTNHELEVRKHGGSTDLSDLIQVQESSPVSNDGSIAHWLREVYESSRGFELGTFDSSLLATIMREQSANWTDIALGYISDVVVIVHDFIDQSLEKICVEQHIKVELLSSLMDRLTSGYNKAVGHVRFLLEVEQTGTPMTQNHYFNDTLEKCRQKRMQSQLSHKSFTDCSHGTVVRLEDMMRNHSMSNVEHVVQDLHDILFSYYRVARKRFVDSVCKQAADHFLVNGPETPLVLFSARFVSGLNEEKLESIAGENHSSRRARVQYEKELAMLEEARKVLR